MSLVRSEYTGDQSSVFQSNIQKIALSRGLVMSDRCFIQMTGVVKLVTYCQI